ncbi:MAG: hypothetical protein ABL921_31545, partial [Pirellula sp.]
MPRNSALDANPHKTLLPRYLAPDCRNCPIHHSMSNGSDQRIRHVAIVLQSLDAATSRSLLGQLPTTQSKLIRQAMVNLGVISPQERSAAFDSVQNLFGPLGLSSTLARSNHRSNSSANSTTNVETPSPASELLQASRNQVDEVEFSRNVPQHANPQNTPPRTESISGVTPSWHYMPDETLAEILQGERPIVIATVLNQVSVERATALVQLLPIQVAGATLAAVPHLGLTDPAILKDIEMELERKLSKYEPQHQLSGEGLSRLQAILGGLPESQKNIWANAISQSNPVLAHKIGWYRAQPTPSIPIPQQAASKVDDIFEGPVVLPFSAVVRASAKSLDAEPPVSSETDKHVSKEKNKQIVAPEFPIKSSSDSPLERLS